MIFPDKIIITLLCFIILLLVYDITSRKNLQKKSLKSEEKYKSIFDNAVLGLFQSKPSGGIIDVNPAFAKIFGYCSPDELISDSFGIANPYFTNPEDQKQYFKLIHENGFLEQYEFKARRKDGTDIWVCANVRAIYDTNNKIIFYEGNITDISDRKVTELALQKSEKQTEKLQEQITQSQKMESIGTLAGGIAHDFNNILFPIIAQTELMLMDTSEKTPFKEGLQKIQKSAFRARDLVRQILTFSRQDSSELTMMKIQPVIKEVLKLIRSTIPTTIAIKKNIHPDCGEIKADPTQIHRIIMNLATNASHAMEETGGELKVTLQQVQIDESCLINPDMKTGDYLELTVEDNGKGMDRKLKQKIFDPFFTTKDVGKGTGMGLSVVHGIVANMGGVVHVESEPEKGSRFHVYLPVVEENREKKAVKTRRKSRVEKGIEQILLVDDEEAIVEIEQKMLEHLGYKVTSCNSSIKTLELFRAEPDRYNLVITDMSMPDMAGDRLAVELIKIRPDIPILLCTGFSQTISEKKAYDMGIKGFLLKPLLIKDLAEKIREVMGAG